MRADLHTHSSRSDGTTSPADLVRAASAAGLDVVALTDHDTTAGWAEAEGAARALGIRLLRGIELSTRHAGHSVHLLGYLPDPSHPGLREELARIVEGRDSRLPTMLARLDEAGMVLSEAEVHEHVREGAVLGRPHVADAIVAAGRARDRTEAFRRWLDPGRPGHVRRHAPELATGVRLVREAGGVPVLAHPWGRGGERSLSVAVIESLRADGLAGLEVDHLDHTAEQRESLRGIADELDLVVTGSSDHHGAGKVGHDLGCHTTAPEQLERLLTLARCAADASGRVTPELV